MSDERSGNERRPDRGALGVGVALAFAGAIIIWNTYTQRVGFSPDPIGQKAFPYLVGVGLLVLSVFTAIEAVRGDFPARDPQNWGPILWIIGGLVAQLVLLYPAGFSVATAMLFACTAYAFGQRQWWKTIPIGIVFALLLWLAFGKGLSLSLPAGPLERLFL